MPQPPIWISHRGLCQQADENSLLAFSRAVDGGFHYLETDLRTTCDGHIVLSHDIDLQRTGSNPINVSHSSRNQLTDIKLNQGAKLLFLDEFYHHFGQLGHVFDIKPESGFEVIEQLAQFKPDLTKTIFLLWDQTQQNRLLELFPTATCFANEPQCRRAGFATLVKMPFLAGLIKNKTYALPPCFMGLDLYKSQLIQSYHHYGAKVLAYLPDTHEQASKALHAGVDFVLSNHDFKLI